MAKRQSRRGVSLNRSAYEAAKLEAANRGMSLATLVEAGLAALGVPIAPHPQQTPELVQKSVTRRAESRALAKVADAAEAVAPAPPVRRRSREREVLGDTVADAYGFA